MAEDIESQIVPTEWTDKDYDYLVDYIICKKLGFKSVKELRMDNEYEVNL